MAPVSTGEPDHEARVRAIWDAYARGGPAAVGALVAPDVVFRMVDGTELHGGQEIGAFLQERADVLTAVAQDFERYGDSVLVHGSLRRFHGGGFLDVQPSWVHFFDGDRLVAVTAYGSRAEALEAAQRDPGGS
jgi:ketosteroid isomerase-like protein